MTNRVALLFNFFGLRSIRTVMCHRLLIIFPQTCLQFLKARFTYRVSRDLFIYRGPMVVFRPFVA